MGLGEMEVGVVVVYVLMGKLMDEE